MATTIACKNGQTTAFVNVPINVASVAAEASVTIQVTTGTPVDVLFSGTNAWIYRATTSVTTNDQPVAAGQPLVLRFYVTTTFFILRSAADGVVTITPLAVSKTVP